MMPPKIIDLRRQRATTEELLTLRRDHPGAEVIYRDGVGKLRRIPLGRMSPANLRRALARGADYAQRQEMLRPAIIAARKKARLTQTKLAALAGMSRPNLTNFEAGRSELTSATLDRLLHVLGLEIREVMRERRK